MQRLFYLLLMLFLVACDPAKTLVLNNRTEHAISLILPDTNKRPFFSDTVNKVEVVPANKYRVLYGFGTWNKEEKKAFAKLVESSKLVAGTDTVSIDSKTSIKRHGILGNELFPLVSLVCNELCESFAQII